MKANDTLKDFYCSEHYYRFTSNLVLTDGAKALADRFKCYWLLDIIWSYQHVTKKKCRGFQVWHLKRTEGDQFLVYCTNGDSKRKIVQQEVPFSDFEADEAELWVEDTVILLPSEH